MPIMFIMPAVAEVIRRDMEQRRFERELEEAARLTREFHDMVRKCDPNTIDLPPDAVREVRKPHALLGASTPFDREIERVAGYPCFADSDGGECD
ncbi:hypothetical protein C9I56_11265 [Paraburkholderia caribensis]|uniref:hypothetical protein n=1 Tax=Paraburkholderia caribensis TaxID=75105 RepID=UPI000D17C42E|nr:hypothetical protein [Paraburkholderia caribensis]PTB28861.1 hypothetical protein C9I56_11265 [Paraburkholderia caribensis]